MIHTHLLLPPGFAGSLPSKVWFLLLSFFNMSPQEAARKQVVKQKMQSACTVQSCHKKFGLSRKYQLK